MRIPVKRTRPNANGSESAVQRCLLFGQSRPLGELRLHAVPVQLGSQSSPSGRDEEAKGDRCGACGVPALSARPIRIKQASVLRFRRYSGPVKPGFDPVIPPVMASDLFSVGNS